MQGHPMFSLVVTCMPCVGLLLASSMFADAWACKFRYLDSPGVLHRPCHGVEGQDAVRLLPNVWQCRHAVRVSWRQHNSRVYRCLCSSSAVLCCNRADAVNAPRPGVCNVTGHSMMCVMSACMPHPACCCALVLLMPPKFAPDLTLQQTGRWYAMPADAQTDTGRRNLAVPQSLSDDLVRRMAEVGRLVAPWGLGLM